MNTIFHLLEDLFLLYIVYKIIFDFIIPVANTTKHVKKQFSNFNSHLREDAKQPYNPQSNTNFKAPKKEPVVTPKTDDYIDFEEI